MLLKASAKKGFQTKFGSQKSIDAFGYASQKPDRLKAFDEAETMLFDEGPLVL